MSPKVKRASSSSMRSAFTIPGHRQQHRGWNIAGSQNPTWTTERPDAAGAAALAHGSPGGAGLISSGVQAISRASRKAGRRLQTDHGAAIGGGQRERANYARCEGRRAVPRTGGSQQRGPIDRPIQRQRASCKTIRKTHRYLARTTWLFC
jgi:hypothetical protein